MTCMELAHYSIGSPDTIFTHCEVGSHAQPAAIADTLGVFRDSIDAMTAIGRKAAAASALNLYELKTRYLPEGLSRSRNQPVLRGRVMVYSYEH